MDAADAAGSTEEETGPSMASVAPAGASAQAEAVGTRAAEEVPAVDLSMKSGGQEVEGGDSGDGGGDRTEDPAASLPPPEGDESMAEEPLSHEQSSVARSADVSPAPDLVVSEPSANPPRAGESSAGEPQPVETFVDEPPASQARADESSIDQPPPVEQTDEPSAVEPIASQGSGDAPAVAWTTEEGGLAETAASSLDLASSTDVDADRRRIVDEFKAKMRAAAARRPETEALLTLCLCVRERAKETDLFVEVQRELPRIGEDFLVPLMGVRRPKPVSSNGAAPASHGGVMPVGERKIGRVKSYNTRKGFGFIDMTGSNQDIFVFNSHLIGRIGLVAGESVEFTLVYDGGRPQARAVKVMSSPQLKTFPMGPGVRRAPEANPLRTLRNEPGLPMSGSMLALQQGLAGKNPQASMRELALAMAAAAAEVPTQLPGQQRAGAAVNATQPTPLIGSPDLYAKIRKAQSASASDKRKPMPKAGAPPDGVASALAPPGRFGGMDWQAPSHGGEDPAEPNAQEEGAFRPGSVVRVVGFPAKEVNNRTGIVQGYDAATQRYNVFVDMNDASGGAGGVGAGSDNVPFQLRASFLQLERHPGGERIDGTGSAGGNKGGNVGVQNELLRKSAAEALKRYNLSMPQQVPQQMPPAAGQWLGMQQAQPGVAAAAVAAAAGIGYPKPGGPDASARPGAFLGQPTQNGFAAQAAAAGAALQGGLGARGVQGPMPVGLLQDGRGQAAPARPLQGPDSPSKSPAVAKAMQGGVPPMSMVGAQRTGLADGRAHLRESLAPPAGSWGVPPPAAPLSGPADRPMQAQAKGIALERWAAHPAGMDIRHNQPPSVLRSAPLASRSPERTQADPRVAAMARGLEREVREERRLSPQHARGADGPKCEGFVGQRWRVLQSKEFNDVIVRESKEVTSAEVRRIAPNEVCVQRGITIELASGVVRMPIEPCGWVTLHARNIKGPTFMVEERMRSGDDVFSGMDPWSRAGAAADIQNQHRPSRRSGSVGTRGPTGPTYKLSQLLALRSKMLTAGQLDAKPARCIRLLNMPGLEGAPSRSERRERRERRERSKAEDRGARQPSARARTSPGPARTSPPREREPPQNQSPPPPRERSPMPGQESPPMPFGTASSAARSGKAEGKPGEEKANCPTQ